MSRSVPYPDYRRPAERAGAALFLAEHPNTSPDTWTMLDQNTRDWWTRKAQPITDAVRRTK